MRQQTTRPVGRRGAVAVMAMMFLVLFTTLTLAMYGMSTANVQSASNLSDVVRAQGAAESGLRWIAMRFWRLTFHDRSLAYARANAKDPLEAPKGVFASTMRKLSFVGDGGRYDAGMHWRVLK